MDTSTRALQEAISIRRQIDALEKRLSSILGASSPGPSTRGGRRRMSAATRAKLAAAAKARWARQKAGEKIKQPVRPGALSLPYYSVRVLLRSVNVQHGRS